LLHSVGSIVVARRQLITFRRQLITIKGDFFMATNRTAAPEQDAIALLIADHKKVKGLFSQFDKLKDDRAEEKSTLVAVICNELKIHTAIEEELFYPAVRKAIDDEDLMDEALVEHAGAKDLIAQLENMDAEDDLYDAKVTVLGEQIEHHVKEEEGSMFPKAKKTKLDTVALGAKMLERKKELLEEMGFSEAEADEVSRPAKRKAGGR
jgi:hemerythrin superfamily protein